MGLNIQDPKFYDMGGGLDLVSSPTKVAENMATKCLNIDYTIDGAARTRFGSSITNVTAGIPTQMSGAPRTLALYDYKNSSGSDIQQVFADGKIKHSLVTPTNQVTGLSTTAIPDIEFQVTNDDEYDIIGNGIDTNLKFNGTTYTNLSLPRPTALSQNALAVGVLNGTYDYYVSFARTVAGVIVEESQLSPVFTTGALVNQQITLNVPVCTETLATGVTAQCNARVIYREVIATGEIHRVTSSATITDNVTTTYTDNTADTTIADYAQADFDNVAAGTSAIFEEYLGRMYLVDITNPSSVMYSYVNKPWSVPIANELILDGPVKCIKRLFGVLVFGTDRSIWVLDGDAETNDPRRVSSKIGILNNRCAVGESWLYILATNRKLYALQPTDFSQSELRLDNPVSLPIETAFDNITANQLENVCMEYYIKANIAKVIVSCPVGTNSNNTFYVYNETQSIKQAHPVWSIGDNRNASCLKQMTISGEIGLYGGDYNGFLWHYEDESKFGDGAEENGTVSSSTASTLTQYFISSTATSATATTLTDSTLTMTTNQYTGYYIVTTGGTGSGQTALISSNTATEFTISAAWGVTPDNTTTYQIGIFVPSSLVGSIVRIIDGTDAEVDQTGVVTANTPTTLTISSTWSTNPSAGALFTVGGYDVYHYTNWKSITESYENLKQSWFVWVNANANGSYTIQMIKQLDFNENVSDQTTTDITLASNNTIWDAFIWDDAPWDAQAVLLNRSRENMRFRSVRIGFYNRKAGQPFQINTLSFSVQDKGLFYRSVA